MTRFFKFADAVNLHFLLLKKPGFGDVMRLILVLSLLVQAADTKKAKKNIPLILQSAESNENTYVNDEFISYLKGNVVFLYDDFTIRSDEATWWRNEGKVHFQDNVKIIRKSQLLTCDKVNFTKQTNQIDAVGHFFYRDTAQLTELTGDKANYLIERKVFTLTGSPKLLRFDTTAAETLIIIGKKINYVDSLKLATVTDDVVITKGKLSSRCQKAQFQTEKNAAYLRIKPYMTYDINELAGDSIDLQFGKESLQSASIGGNAHGVYIDTGGKSNDTTFTHVWGDSLYVSVSDSGALDSLWVHDKAVSKYFTALEKDLVNQANGKTMLIAFGAGGNVDKVKIWGNARSTYYIEEDDSRGTNEASGDSMTVAFRNGKFVFLNLAGSARGKFFPNDL
jgi:hypothetical protein